MIEWSDTSQQLKRLVEENTVAGFPGLTPKKWMVGNLTFCRKLHRLFDDSFSGREELMSFIDHLIHLGTAGRLVELPDSPGMRDLILRFKQCSGGASMRRVRVWWQGLDEVARQEAKKEILDQQGPAGTILREQTLRNPKRWDDPVAWPTFYPFVRDYYLCHRGDVGTVPVGEEVVLHDSLGTS